MNKNVIEVQDLDVSIRLRNLLISAAIRYIDELKNFGENELINDFGFGLKSIKELKQVLLNHNIHLKDDLKIKKYRLILIYPGSAIKGTIAETYLDDTMEEDNQFYFINEPITNKKYLILKDHIENYPRNWQKIK